VTLKNGKTGRYLAPGHWLDAFGDIENAKRERILSAFNEFFNRVDIILSDAVNNKIHIKSEKHPDGLLELSNNNIKMPEYLGNLAIAATFLVQLNPTIREFARQCIQQLFWPAMDESLEKVRSYIQLSLQARLRDALEKLNMKVCTLVDSESARDFTREVTLACEDLQMSTESVSHWFRGPGPGHDEHRFKLDELINIALAATRKMRPNFSPVMKTNVAPEADGLLSLNALTLIDALFIIFDNVSRRSGFEDRNNSPDSQPTITTKISSSDGELCISITSDIHHSVDIGLVDNRLREIRDGIQRGDYISESQLDGGGSGLYRLVAAFDFGARGVHAVSFGLVDSRSFNVSVRAPMKYFRLQALPLMEAA
jgi:hypothetical protein